jgi:hypothetical protein
VASASWSLVWIFTTKFSSARNITIFPLILDPLRLSFLRKKLVSVEQLVDEIIEIAPLHALEVNILSYHRELFTECEGIAAVVYAPVTAT